MISDPSLSENFMMVILYMTFTMHTGVTTCIRKMQQNMLINRVDLRGYQMPTPFESLSRGYRGRVTSFPFLESQFHDFP